MFCDELPFRNAPFAAVRAGGERPALVTSERVLSYRALDRESDRVRDALLRAGAGPGTVVSLALPNGWAWAVALLAPLKCGAVLAPANSLLTAAETTALASVTGPAVVLRHTGDLDGPARARRRGDDGVRPPAGTYALAHTSGTTGTPRAVVQTERAVHGAVAYWARQRRADDVVATALPLAHTYGHLVAASTFLAGATLALAGRFRPAGLARLIVRHRATAVEAVPTMYARMLAHVPSGALGHVRCLSSGQALPEGLSRAWYERTGAPLTESWGMTELAGPGLAFDPGRAGRDGWAGYPVRGHEFALRPLASAAGRPPGAAGAGQADGTGETEGERETGEILVRGPEVSPGCYDRSAGVVPLADADGWLHTGDVAERDAEGCFRVLDRCKDLINSGGHNIFPTEVENVLARHPAVLSTAVVGVAHHDLGEVPRAYVVPAPGRPADAGALLRHCRAHLADYKVPRSVVFRDDLPVTGSGKLRRNRLRDTEPPGPPPGPCPS
ncbi:class I adenylate-forming enzyme family protein [Streptomyces sp. NPDC058319]|uniref:class I adenylate-forming enzyme family protein n=1 Tax=unclassified Streptomyces TaxID=2593676 RepID=UPI0036E4BECF